MGKRVCAVILVLAMILCQMPAVTAKAVSPGEEAQYLEVEEMQSAGEISESAQVEEAGKSAQIGEAAEFEQTENAAETRKGSGHRPITAWCRPASHP